MKVEIMGSHLDYFLKSSLLNLMCTYLTRFPDSQNGHAGNDGVGIVLGGAVDSVIGANNQDQVGVGEVIIDLVHLQHT